VPRGTDRVTVGNGASIDIDLTHQLYAGHTQNRAGTYEYHRGEGFVDFQEIHILDRQVVLRQYLCDGESRYRSDIFHRLGHFRVVT